MRPYRCAAIAAMLVLGVSRSSASAFDVTGSYEGKASCKGFGDGQKFALKIDIAAGLSQSGRDVNVEFAGLQFLARASGVAIPNAKKPDKGEIGIVACGSHAEPAFGVTIRAKVATKTGKPNATIKFATIVAGKDFTGLGVTDGAFTWTGTLKRTATLDPVWATARSEGRSSLCVPLAVERAVLNRFGTCAMPTRLAPARSAPDLSSTKLKLATCCRTTFQSWATWFDALWQDRVPPSRVRP